LLTCFQAQLKLTCQEIITYVLLMCYKYVANVLLTCFQAQLKLTCQEIITYVLLMCYKYVANVLLTCLQAQLKLTCQEIITLRKTVASKDEEFDRLRSKSAKQLPPLSGMYPPPHMTHVTHMYPPRS